MSAEGARSRRKVVDECDRLRDDDAAYLMGMNTKELHKLCGRLKEARFLSVYGTPLLACY